MANTTANILVGQGDLSIAGNIVGFTVGGFFLREEPEFFEALGDQSIGVQKKKLVRRRLFARADLGEASLINIRLAYGLPSAALSGITLQFDGTELGVVTAGFIGTNPAGFNRTMAFSRIVSMEAVEQNYQRDDQTIVPMEFEILPSIDAADVFFTMVDATS